MHQELSLALPTLRKGSVTSVRHRRPAVIKVLSGEVWLTETPAKGDRVLTAGEQLRLGRTAPWVIEALSDARIEIHTS